MIDEVYSPREDSYMLEYQVRCFAQGVVLDMGTGSGIQALAAAHLANVKQVYAVDVDKKAIEYSKKYSKHEKINYICGNLFSSFKKKIKFDTIIFNPPYLPQDHKIQRLALEGGKKGYEVIQLFLNQVNEFLAEKGIILLVFSSLSNKNMVEQLITNNLLTFEQLSTKRLFFETLYVYKLEKRPELRDLESKGVVNTRYFSKGKRGIIFTGSYDNKKIAMKVKHPESQAQERIKNETEFLQKLNKYSIGPRYLFSGNNYLAYKFVEGVYIKDWLPTAEKKDIQKVVSEIFRQSFMMDKLGINKEEMHHPLKHVIIGKKIVMIDFEKCHYTQDPKNVTQLGQYIVLVARSLNKRGFNIDINQVIKCSKEYKKNMSEQNMNNIISTLK
ncbi:methyltransferase [Candidatus Woesearchaeota archaeon]|nr:methyltransferase [Candidatus Woesearchaeota archaeon]